MIEFDLFTTPIVGEVRRLLTEFEAEGVPSASSLSVAESRKYSDGYYLTRSDMKWFWSHYLRDQNERIRTRLLLWQKI